MVGSGFVCIKHGAKWIVSGFVCMKHEQSDSKWLCMYKKHGVR